MQPNSRTFLRGRVARSSFGSVALSLERRHARRFDDRARGTATTLWGNGK